MVDDVSHLEFAVGSPVSGSILIYPCIDLLVCGLRLAPNSSPVPPRSLCGGSRRLLTLAAAAGAAAAVPPPSQRERRRHSSPARGRPMSPAAARGRMFSQQQVTVGRGPGGGTRLLAPPLTDLRLPGCRSRPVTSARWRRPSLGRPDHDRTPLAAAAERRSVWWRTGRPAEAGTLIHNASRAWRAAVGPCSGAPPAAAGPPRAAGLCRGRRCTPPAS